MPQQHPLQLHAAAALWSLRAALRYLAEHREAIVLSRPQFGPATSRPRSLASLQRHDQLLREERAERAAGSLQGLKPGSPHAAPGDAPGLLDLHRQVGQALIDVHGMLAYFHHRDPLLAWSGHWHTILDREFDVQRDARWAWMAAVLPVTRPKLADAARIVLEDTDQRVRAYAGMDRDLLAPPLAPACPACGQRRLRIQHSAPDSGRWTIVCSAPDCVCLGARCGCGMDIPWRRVPHIWAADSALATSIRAGVAVGSAA